MQKARRHPFPNFFRHRASTACRYAVSGLFHSPNRGSFHLSLTVLCAIGRQEIFSLGRWSPRIRTRFHETGTTWENAGRVHDLNYAAITRYGPPFQMVRLPWTFLTPFLCHNQEGASLDSTSATVVPLHGYGLGSSLFARRYWGNRMLFLFLRVLRCFNSPGSPRTPMNSAHADKSSTCRVAPFGNLRITSCLALTRSLSQPRHVLHRSLPPRHPPHTLSSLTVLTRRHSLFRRDTFPSQDLTVKLLRFMQLVNLSKNAARRRPRRVSYT